MPVLTTLVKQIKLRERVSEGEREGGRERERERERESILDKKELGSLLPLVVLLILAASLVQLDEEQLDHQ